MAKILILFHQVVVDINNKSAIVCYYESLAKELAKCCNTVKILNVALFKDYMDSSIKYLSEQDEENLLEKIKIFNPDLIFAFNNQMLEKFYDITNCPICIFDADSVDLFVSKNKIAKYSERYYLFTCSKSWEENKYSSLGLIKDHIDYIHFATSIKNESLEKDKNISFIGSNFSKMPDYIRDRFIKDSKKTYLMLMDFWNNGKGNTAGFLKKYYPEFPTIKETELYQLWDMRNFILNSVLDLGLNLYGVYWENLPIEMLNLKLAYNKTPKYSLQHNQDIYNSSKINLSISHPQCNGYTFPWRIYDIMASNGLLISSYSGLLKKQTKGFVDIPMFENPYEARNLCKYALNNPHYCEDIIEASNKFIEDHGRWNDNFKTIENLTGVKLCNQSTDSEKSDFEILKYKIEKRTKICLKNRIRLRIYKKLRETLKRKNLIH